MPFPTRLAVAGVWEEDGELWTPAGELIAQSRQLALIRELPRDPGFLGLGSNVGDRRENLQAAVAALPGHGVRVLASSSIYDTEPVGLMLDQPDFLNACLRIDTELGPEPLLDACKDVERELGRLAGGVAPWAAPDRRRPAAARRRALPLRPAHAPARAR